MNNWKPYFKDRLKLDHASGFIIIVPKDRIEPIPVYCPVCRLLMQSADDAEYFRAKSCCEKCGMKWADPNLEKWHQGYRPDPSEIKTEVTRRQSIPISLNLDALDV